MPFVSQSQEIRDSINARVRERKAGNRLRHQAIQEAQLIIADGIGELTPRDVSRIATIRAADKVYPNGL